MANAGSKASHKMSATEYLHPYTEDSCVVVTAAANAMFFKLCTVNQISCGQP